MRHKNIFTKSRNCPFFPHPFDQLSHFWVAHYTSPAPSTLQVQMCNQNDQVVIWLSPGDWGAAGSDSGQHALAESVCTSTRWLPVNWPLARQSDCTINRPSRSQEHFTCAARFRLEEHGGRNHFVRTILYTFLIPVWYRFHWVHAAINKIEFSHSPVLKLDDELHLLNLKFGNFWQEHPL